MNIRKFPNIPWGHFFKTKNFLEKFFDDAYFRGMISARDFPLLRGSLFEAEILGKNIFDKLFGPYSEKSLGSPGEGVQGTG